MRDLKLVFPLYNWYKYIVKIIFLTLLNSIHNFEDLKILDYCRQITCSTVPRQKNNKIEKGGWHSFSIYNNFGFQKIQLHKIWLFTLTMSIEEYDFFSTIRQLFF